MTRVIVSATSLRSIDDLIVIVRITLPSQENDISTATVTTPEGKAKHRGYRKRHAGRAKTAIRCVECEPRPGAEKQ